MTHPDSRDHGPDDSRDSGGPASRGVGSSLGALCAHALTGVLLLVVLAWFAGRVVSDRTLTTQYLSWIPTLPVLLVAVLVTVAQLGLRTGSRTGSRVGKPRVVVPLLTSLVAAWLLLGEWRVHRAVLPSPQRGPLRVLFMNISPGANHASLLSLFSQDADIAVLSNVHPQPVTFEKIYGVRHQDLLEHFTGIVPGDAPPGEAHLIRSGMFHIYSKHPIRRRAAAYVANQESWIENDTGGGGSVLMLEIETPQGVRTVWAVDMPSTIGASRRSLFEQTREAIDTTTRVHAIDEVGRWITFPFEADDPLRTPDIVVGDFNTPVHSWSVERFLPSTRPARDDAGWGLPGTFPSQFPLFEIDFARLGAGARATHLTKLRAEGCRHLGLVLDLER